MMSVKKRGRRKPIGEVFTVYRQCG